MLETNRKIFSKPNTSPLVFNTEKIWIVLETKIIKKEQYGCKQKKDGVERNNEQREG